MQLSIHDRLTLLAVLPKEGDFLTLKIIRKLREDLSFSEEELKANKVVQNGDGTITWQEHGHMKDIAVGEKATDVVVAALKALDEQKKLTDAHFSLYEKFVAVND
jgi:hypothetical protein